MRARIQLLRAEGQTHALSTAGIHVVVDTNDGPCERCQAPTRVQKTHQHRVVTLEHGDVQAHETVRVCSAGCQHPSGTCVTRRAEVLSEKVQPGGVYGYDLEVRVGLRRFRDHRQREEIRAELRAHYGIDLSAGEVSHLAARFVEHVAELHTLRAPELRKALEKDGGYPMHIDATGEDGRGTLFMAYAGSRQWVLGAWKIATERAELILPCLRQTVARFGPPMAIMRDLGRAVILASQSLVQELARPLPILCCHFHFLRDLGKDLLSDGHDALRELFRRFAIRPALRTLARDLGHRLRGLLPDLRAQIVSWAGATTDHVIADGKLGLATVRALAQWVLDYPAEARHSVPFDLPYLAFFRRCVKVRRAVDAFLRHPSKDVRVRSALARLARVLDPVIAQVPFERYARALLERAALFTELRTALRIHEPDQGRPHSPRLSTAQEATQLHDIQAAVEALTGSLRERRPARGPATEVRHAIDLVLVHLDRHGPSLWGHLIALPKSIGGGLRVVDRTNQCAEGFWHRLKHGERRRSGRKILTYDFESLPAAAVLVSNLDHDDYVAILSGSLAQLPVAFARLDQARRRRGQETPKTTAKTQADDSLDLEDVVSASFPRDDRRLIRASHLGDRIETAAHSRAPRRLATRSSSERAASPTPATGRSN